MRYYLRWFAALIVAGLFSIWTRTGWRRIGIALTLWKKCHEDKADEPTRRGRIEVCRNCPLYFKPFGTCGSPLSRHLRGLGCWCFMEEKSRYLNARCWLDENLESPDYGWRRSGVGL